MDKSIFQQSARFVIVGVSTTAIHYGLYLLFKIWTPIWLAYTISYILELILNYTLTNFFTFKTAPSTSNGVAFLFARGLCYVLEMLLLKFFLWIGLSSTLAPLPIYLVVGTINFFNLRFFFTRRKKESLSNNSESDPC